MYLLLVSLGQFELMVAPTLVDTPMAFVSNRKHLKVVTFLLASIIPKTILFLGLIICAAIRCMR